jgi:hypothetical protein
MAYLRLDFFRGTSVFAACRSLLPFAFDRVTHDLLERCARSCANERHPWNNIALAMLYAHDAYAIDPSDPSVFGGSRPDVGPEKAKKHKKHS